MRDEIYVISDSACDFKKEYLPNRNFKMIPYWINFSNSCYRDVYEISSDDFYKMLEKEIPKTAIASVLDIKEAYLKALELGFKNILVLSVSGAVSGMANAYNLAKEGIEAEVEIVDTKRAGMSAGMFVVRAFELMDRGLGLKDIASRLRLESKTNKFFLTVDTLKYLRYGGRISHVKGSIAEIFRLKPIISVNERGEYFNLKSVRGRKNSLKTLVQLTRDELSKKKNYYLSISFGNCEEDSIFLEEELKSLIENAKFYKRDRITSSIATHTGPEAIAISTWYFKD